MKFRDVNEPGLYWVDNRAGDWWAVEVYPFADGRLYAYVFCHAGNPFTLAYLQSEFGGRDCVPIPKPAAVAAAGEAR